MTSGRRPRRSIVLAALSAIALVAATAATAGSGRSSAGPPNGVYTCAWIASHASEALQAGVTCDPKVFFAGMSSNTATATPDANGCRDVPSSGTVGQGVFAWSPYEYSKNWQWYANYGPANYTWYIQTSGGTNYTHGDLTDTLAHNVGVPPNIYRWGAQNHSTTAEYWFVCFTD